MIGLNHITLAVTDLDRSVSFYCNALDATLKAIWDKGVYLEVGTIWLCLAMEDNVTIRTDDTHVAFSALDFEMTAAKISAHAALWKDNVSEGQSLYFLDPDGHKLELHEGSLASRLAHYAAQSDGKVKIL